METENMRLASNGHAPLGSFRAATHQQAVDEAQARIRADLASGKRSLFRPPPTNPGQTNSILEHRIAEELELVVRNLEQLGDTLSADPILLHRHAPQLQSIDLMQQALGHLGRVLAAGDKTMAVDQISLGELKARLKRKALRAISE